MRRPTETRVAITLLLAAGLVANGSILMAGPTLAATDRSQGARPELARDRIEATLPLLDEFVAGILASTGVPGLAVAVVANDAVVYSKSHGVRDVTSGEPVDRTTVFQIASLSKPLASTVLAGVVGDGVIGWDDPVRLANPDLALSASNVSWSSRAPGPTRGYPPAPRPLTSSR